MAVRITTRGSSNKAEVALRRMQRRTYLDAARKYGPMGVDALKAATPWHDDGEVQGGWYWFTIERAGYFSLQWANSYMPKGISIAAILQYGHGTRQGGYVQGVDYINPAMRPIFDQIATDMWKEVTK